MAKKCKKCRSNVYGTTCSKCNSRDLLDDVINIATDIAIGSAISSLFDSGSSSSSSYSSSSDFGDFGGGDFGGGGSGDSW